MPADADTGRTARQIRVITGVTCYFDAESALTLSAELARKLDAELHGVMAGEIADTSAPIHAHARILSFSGKSLTDYSQSALIDAFRMDARQFERALKVKADAASLQSSFSTKEGRLHMAMDEAAKSGDILVYGFRPILRTGGAVAVIVDQAQDIPEFASDLAATLGIPLIKLLLRPNPIEVLDPATPASGRDKGEGERSRTDVDDILHRLERMSLAAVILASRYADQPFVEHVQSAARCPVVVQYTSAMNKVPEERKL